MTSKPTAAARSAQTLSEAERIRRQEAVDFARANVALEGFAPDAATEALFARLIAGELTSDGLTRAVRAASGL